MNSHSKVPVTAAPKKKHTNVTVPQSPQFSKMSWQRSREAKRDRNSNTNLHHTTNRSQVPDRYNSRTEQEETRKARASSAPRARTKEQTGNGHENSSTRLNGPNGSTSRHTTAAHIHTQDPQVKKNHSAHSSAAAGTMGRSVSSGRMGARRGYQY